MDIVQQKEAWFVSAAEGNKEYLQQNQQKMRNIRDNFNRSALMVSISTKNFETANYLAEFEAQQVTNLGLTALMSAVVIDAPLSLIERLAQTERRCQTNDGVSALMLACLHNRQWAPGPLKEEVGLKDKKGRPALVYALLAGNVNLITQLLPYEGYITDINDNNMLFYAARSLKLDSWKIVFESYGFSTKENQLEGNSSDADKLYASYQHIEPQSQENSSAKNNSLAIAFTDSVKSSEIQLNRMFEAFIQFGETFNNQFANLDKQNYCKIISDFLSFINVGPREIVIMLEHNIFYLYPQLQEQLINQINKLENNMHMFSTKKQSILQLLINNQLFSKCETYKVLGDQLDMKNRTVLHYLAQTIPQGQEKQQYDDLVCQYLQIQELCHDADENTPIHLACETQNFDFLELWLQNQNLDKSKSEVFQQQYHNKNKQTPLHILLSQKLQNIDQRAKSIIVTLIRIFGNALDQNDIHFLNLIAFNGQFKAFGGTTGFQVLISNENEKETVKDKIDMGKLLQFASKPPSVDAAEKDHPDEYLYFCQLEGECSRRAIYSVLHFDAAVTLKTVMDVARGVRPGPKKLCENMLSQRYKGHDLLYWAVAGEAWHCVRLLCFCDVHKSPKSEDTIPVAETNKKYLLGPAGALPDAGFVSKNGITPLMQAVQSESADAVTLHILAQRYGGRVLTAPFLGLPKGSCALMMLLALSGRENLLNRVSALVSERLIKNSVGERAYDIGKRVGVSSDVLELLL